MFQGDHQSAVTTQDCFDFRRGRSHPAVILLRQVRIVYRDTIALLRVGCHYAPQAQEKQEQSFRNP
jgi:hypothetical protein